VKDKCWPREMFAVAEFARIPAWRGTEAWATWTFTSPAVATVRVVRSIRASSKRALGRVPPIARLMALALRFDEYLRRGQVANHAALAELGHVSRDSPLLVVDEGMLAAVDSTSIFPERARRSATMTIWMFARCGVDGSQRA